MKLGHATSHILLMQQLMLDDAVVAAGKHD